jgi:hypothetical protein
MADKRAGPLLRVSAAAVAAASFPGGPWLARFLTPAGADHGRAAAQQSDQNDGRMMRRVYGIIGAAVLPLLFAVSVQAQVFTPTFQSSRILNEWGIYLSDGPGDLAVEGLWRGGPLGLRAGFVDGYGGLLSLSGEFRTPIAVPGAPIGVAFAAAVQGLIGDESAIGAQGGVSVGYTFRGNGVAFTPYVHPRLAVVTPIRDSGDADLELMADLGFDVEFTNRLLLRLGLNMGGGPGSAWGFGIGWRR